MKIKEGFVLKKVGDINVVVPIGAKHDGFNGLIKLNETGLFVWQRLEKGENEESIAKTLTEEYDVTYEKALEDVKAYVEKMREAQIIDE